MIKKHRDKILLVSLIYVFLSGVLPTSGTVFDESTNKPMKGVYVVASWEGYSILGFELNKFCLKSMVTRTHDNGRYYFPFWIKSLSDWSIINVKQKISVYNAGFVNDVSKTDASSNYSRKYFLKAFDGTREKRLKTLARFDVGCRDIYSTKQGRMIVNAIYKEAKNTMSTNGKYKNVPSTSEKIWFEDLKVRMGIEPRS